MAGACPIPMWHGLGLQDRDVLQRPRHIHISS